MPKLYILFIISPILCLGIHMILLRHHDLQDTEKKDAGSPVSYTERTIWNGRYFTDSDCHDHLYGGGHHYRSYICAESKCKLGRLFPRREKSRPVGDGYERGGVRHVRMAPHGSAGRGVLVRYRGCGMDSHRSGSRYIHQLADRIQASAPLQRESGKCDHTAGIFFQSLS